VQHKKIDKHLFSFIIVLYIQFVWETVMIDVRFITCNTIM